MVYGSGMTIDLWFMPDGSDNYSPKEVSSGVHIFPEPRVFEWRCKYLPLLTDTARIIDVILLCLEDIPRLSSQSEHTKSTIHLCGI